MIARFLKKSLGCIISSINTKGTSCAEKNMHSCGLLLLFRVFFRLYPSSVFFKLFSQSSQETGATLLKNLGTVLPMASVHGILFDYTPLGGREARSHARAMHKS